MIRKLLNISALLAIIYIASAANARAAQDDWNKRTVMTINRTIEIAGKIIPPGKYIFEIVSLQAERNVVRVTGADDNKVYATVIAIPNFRRQATEETELTFYEARRGTPEPLRAWFYPNHTLGVEFVYPKKRAVEIAAVAKVNVPAENPPLRLPTEPSPTIKELLEEPLVAVTPAGQEVPVAEVRPPVTPAPAVAAAPPPPPPSVAAEPTALPKTASPYPWIGLIGFASAAAAMATRFLRR